MLNPMSHIPQVYTSIVTTIQPIFDPNRILGDPGLRSRPPTPKLRPLCIPYEWEDLGAKGRVQSDKKDFLDLYLYKNLYLIH